DFRSHGYDLKRLFRLIVQSQTYQLSSVTNGSDKTDRINYSHALVRPLEAEVLLDAVSEATGVPETFAQDQGANQHEASSRPRAITMKVPGNSRFLVVFGRSQRDALPEGYTKASLSQALHMLVGSTYTEKLSKERSRVDRLLQSGASNEQIVEELYLAS